LARVRIAATLQSYRRLFAHYTGLNWSGVTDFARRYESVIAEHDAAFVAEMRGIAAGAAVGFDDILAINVRTEILYGLGVIRPAECSSFAALPNAVKSGHTLIGQNWDWHPAASECCVVLSIEQSPKPSILTVVEAGLLAKFGMNSKGVGVAMNALATDIDRGELGIPVHILLRSVLSSENLSDAVRVVTGSHRASSGNYLIASREGSAVNLECAPGGSERVFAFEPEAGLLAHANCFSEEAAGIRDETARLRPGGKVRKSAMEGKLRERAGNLTPAGMMLALADHTNSPDSICRHPIDSIHPLNQEVTVASVVTDLDTADMWIADGPPCEVPYQKYRGLDLWSLIYAPPPTSANDSSRIDNAPSS
jgi:isopenicillin-N N-acyltransferase-like protein